METTYTLRQIMDGVKKMKEMLHDDDTLVSERMPSVSSFVEAARGMTLAQAQRQLQYDMVTDSIKTYNGNLTLAAQSLGLHRANIYRKMADLVITVADVLSKGEQQ